MININNFRGDLSDVSAKNASLVTGHRQGRKEPATRMWTPSIHISASVFKIKFSLCWLPSMQSSWLVEAMIQIAWLIEPVALVQTKHRWGHPENHLFPLSKNNFSGSKSPKINQFNFENRSAGDNTAKKMWYYRTSFRSLGSSGLPLRNIKREPFRSGIALRNSFSITTLSLDDSTTTVRPPSGAYAWQTCMPNHSLSLPVFFSSRNIGWITPKIIHFRCTTYMLSGSKYPTITWFYFENRSIDHWMWEVSYRR